ncbi:unnamed protein product [Tetraodon nigroviridis]|uniref:(spotted green pufferfish) hypothetical protein n=1 Tax=Tetraodon nigroviridis TaxID=99883 RepID=Q4T915_TETNG|nr:unnamed protein product [Tetraodon nigroviridis]
MGTFVTLAEVLEARGSPLDEDEVWCLLLATTEALLDISQKGSGNMCNVLSPGSVLLSDNGNLAFKSCARYENVASFRAPEVQQGLTSFSRNAAEKPVHLSSELEGLLLSMCEDVASRRTDLLTVLETCGLRHRASMLPPAERLIRKLVEEVYRTSQRESYSSWQQLNRSPCSQYMDSNRNSTSKSLSQFESTISLNEKKVKVSQNVRYYLYI